MDASRVAGSEAAERAVRRWRAPTGDAGDAGVAGKPLGGRLSVRTPERASLWSAGVSVVCSLSGRRWPHSARSGARGHALRETLAPQPRQRLGHRGRPSGPVPRVVAGAPRPEVTAGVALSPSLSPRDGILSLAVSDVLRGPGRAGLGRSAHAHAGTGRADPEAGSRKPRAAPPGGRCVRARKLRPRLDFAET